MPKKMRPVRDGRIPPQALMLMSNKELAEMKAAVRDKMRPGHPDMPKEEWDRLCNLECQLHLESVNRYFIGIKTRRLKYK